MRWTEDQRNVVRRNKHLPAALIQKERELTGFTVKAVQRQKDNLRGEGLVRNGVPLSAQERELMLKHINEPNRILSAMFQRKPDEIDRHVNRIRREENLPGRNRGSKSTAAPSKILTGTAIKLDREPRVRTSRKGVQKNASTKTPIKRRQENSTDKGEQLLHLALEIIKSADPELMKRIRSRRNQKDDNPELVALWDYLRLPQAKDLSPDCPARVLCKRLRVATEHHNRLLRNLAPEKSANVSTFQYNWIRHICGIRITSFTDHKIHGNLTLELIALTRAVEDVKNNK